MYDLDKFCLTYNNDHKRLIMQQKFAQLNWHVHVQEGFHAEQGERAPTCDQLSRIKHRQRWDPHAWSVMQGHMHILETYVSEHDAPYVLVMEDDIHIRRDINDHLPKIMQDMSILDLDVLLLGYLTPAHLHHIHTTLPVVNQPFTFHEYPFNVYGLQMYVMSRTHAQVLVNTYGKNTEWHSQVLDSDSTYNPDWILSKQGKRACVYPLLAIETAGGGAVYGDHDQTQFHLMCHQAHFDANKFL